MGSRNRPGKEAKKKPKAKLGQPKHWHIFHIIAARRTPAEGR